MCRRVLSAEHLDDGESPASLDEAEASASAAAEAAATARERRVALETQLEQYTAQMARLQTERDELVDMLEGRSRAELEAKQAEITEARRAQEAASRALTDARAAEREVEEQIASIADKICFIKKRPSKIIFPFYVAIFVQFQYPYIGCSIIVSYITILGI